ncbi:uncharacterized protein LOC135820939 [Sycon ciliatum]|uniref:uncharacterized protein LOC135820939 n=1 Tax=Sycon ciliatum TaxID=27933 RepID=UPI0031F68D1B
MQRGLQIPVPQRYHRITTRTPCTPGQHKDSIKNAPKMIPDLSGNFLRPNGIHNRPPSKVFRHSMAEQAENNEYFFDSKEMGIGYLEGHSTPDRADYNDADEDDEAAPPSKADDANDDDVGSILIEA